MTVTDTQLYFAVGLPVFAIIVSMMVNVLQTTTINARMTSLESSMNARFVGLETRFDTLLGKVIEIDNRLTRLEERLEHR